MCDTIEAGMSAKPIAITNTMNTPLACYSNCLKYALTGNGAVVTLNLRFGLPVASFRMASYIN